MLSRLRFRSGTRGGRPRQCSYRETAIGLPTTEECINAAERELGRNLPDPLRERLKRNNGGDVKVTGYSSDDPCWELHPVLDRTDRKRASRSANHIVRETEEAHSVAEVAPPRGSVVIADNGTGNLLLLLKQDDCPYWWDHETGDVHRVTVDWS